MRTRRERRRSSKIWVFLLLLALLAGAGYLCYTYLVVQNVEVVGNGEYDAEEVRQLANVPMGKNLLLVDKDRIEANLQRSPLVVVNKISIKLPDTVVLDIRIRNKMAVVQYAENCIYIDEEGYILEIDAAGQNPGYLSVEGLNVTAFSLGEQLKTADEQQLAALQQVIAPLYAYSLQERIAVLDLQNTNHILLTTREGIKVILGSVDNIEKKMQWIASILPELEQDGYRAGKLNVSANTPSFLPEGTGEPASSSDPGATLDPNATPDPDATTDPGGSPEPERTVAPSATPNPGATEPAAPPAP